MPAKRSAERVDQKERTRQKLLAAARELVEAGETPTIARTAERAAVAEATAYRYYSSPRALLRDALAIEWTGLDEVIVALEAMPDPGDRAARAAEELTRFVLAHEQSVRLLFASTDQEPRDPATRTGLPRASFRRRLVEAVLGGADDREAELGLVVVVSPSAVLTLRDAQLEPPEIARELARMARRMLTRPS